LLDPVGFLDAPVLVLALSIEAAGQGVDDGAGRAGHKALGPVFAHQVFAAGDDIAAGGLAAGLLFVLT
jgi:hypothetical protein